MVSMTGERYTCGYSVEEARKQADEIINFPGNAWPCNYRPLCGIAGTLLASLQSRGRDEHAEADWRRIFVLWEHVGTIMNLPTEDGVEAFSWLRKNGILK